MEVVYEDNHIIIVYKESGEIVQGDKTGDRPLSDIVKDYIKEKYQKPGSLCPHVEGADPTEQYVPRWRGT